MATKLKQKKIFGTKQSISDIMKNEETGNLYFTLDMGFFGKKNVGLFPNEEGTYNLITRAYKKDKTFQDVIIGKTFAVKRTDGTVVTGITQTSLALGSTYDKDKKKNLNDNKNALHITTHMLKKTVKISDKVSKIGYIDGSYGIQTTIEVPTTETPEYVENNTDEEEVIPF